MLRLAGQAGILSANPLTGAWIKAVQDDDGAALASLLEKDPSLLQTNVGETSPVMWCSKNGKANALKVLIKAGLSPNGWEQAVGMAASYNSVMVAAMNGHADVCEVLLGEGKVDPNYRAHSTNALLLAARNHHLSVIKVLDKYGADMNAKNGEGSNALLETSRFTSHPRLVDYLVSRGVSCDVEGNDGMTALMHLANIGDIESIQILAEKGGANLAHTNRAGDSMLSIAERRNMSEVVCYCWMKGLTPTNVAMPCHLGDLHVIRPKITNSIGGRYQAACCAVGSKIYIYGGQSIDIKERDVPIIKGEPLNAEDEQSLPSDAFHPNTGEEKISDHNARDNVHPAPDQPDFQEDNGELDFEDDLGADQPEDVQRAQNFANGLQAYIRARAGQLLANGPVDIEQVLLQYARAIVNGQIAGDMEMALGMIGNIGNADQQDQPLLGMENDDELQDDDDLSDDDELDGVGNDIQQLNPPLNDILLVDDEDTDMEAPQIKRPKKNEAPEPSATLGGPASSGALLPAQTTDESDSDTEEEDRFSVADSFASDDEEIHARSGSSYKTYVLDLDDCRLDYIFPNPQLQPKLAKYKLRTSKKGRFVGIDADGLGGYTIAPEQDQSFPPCLAIATKAFSPEAGPFGYFELKVLNPGIRRLITMGLVPARYPVEGKQPGWLEGSFGLHGDDGALFYGSGSGDSFADRFEPGDVIGCGVSWQTNQVFFTINGRFLGYAPIKPKCRLYACVGVRNENARFRVNFGGSEPFRFDFRAPTLSWSLIIPTTTSARPSVTKPYFANAVSRRFLLLFSAAGNSSDIYLFHLDKHFYTKRTTKGVSPSMRSNESQIVQPIDQSCFAFVPRAKHNPPVLAILDTQALEWNDIGAGFGDFQQGVSPQAAHAGQWQELLSVLDHDDFVACYMCTIDGQLVWIGKNNYIIADSITGMYSQQSLSNKSVQIRTQGSLIDEKGAAFVFGGWDGQSQSNELDVFNLMTGSWYKPAYTGVIPRPRNAHCGVKVQTKAAYFSYAASDLPSGLLLDEPQTVMVNAFGWSGRNVISDIDIISIAADKTDSKKLASDSIALDSSLPSDLILRVRVSNENVIYSSSVASFSLQTNSNVVSFPAHKVVLFCRASTFRTLLQAEPSLQHLDLVVENLECFKGFLNFIYTDSIVREPKWIEEHARALASLVALWAPDLTPKLMERLLLTRTTLPNLFGSQMLLAYNNELFSDLELEVAALDLPSSVFIPVHKTVLISRSPYFRAMCTGGLAEASQNVIRIGDVPVEALKLVLEFLYTYEVPYDRCSEHIVDMFVLACRFQISKLKATLENLLIFNLAIDNVCGLLLVAHSQTSLTLLKECKRFIESHMAELELSPDYIEMKESVDLVLRAISDSAMLSRSM